MPPLAGRHGRTTDPLRLFEGLDGLPVRPLSARAVLESAAPGDHDDPRGPAPDPTRLLQSDPGWAAFAEAEEGPSARLDRVAGRPWWRAPSDAAAEALETLWKHSVAASCAARRLANESGRTDAEALARAALLHGLGLWAIAAAAPEHLPDLLALRDRGERLRRERSLFGRDSTAIGRDLAARWGLSPLVEAAAWLHADASADLNGLAGDAPALALIQQAHRWAERTPWALGGSPLPEPGPPDPRLRLLIAEVQVRCSGGLLDPEATPREEELSRAHARLLLRLADRERSLASRDRLIRTLGEARAAESPESWTERAGLSWCEEPGVASARVVWPGSPPEDRRAAPRIVPLGHGPRPSAELHLWGEVPGERIEAADDPALIAAWGAWADLLADRERRGLRLDEAVSAHRSRVARDEAEDRTARLAALAEFAGGAGHELNNPLAVILGRAQLLIPRVAEPEATRSLRIIIAQAQRAHRILRDLMYVARPPAPRPRPCQPDEILRASLRDLRPEAEARGVHLTVDPQAPSPIAWADPDPLRHLADVLIRNALEATPAGGSVRVTSSREGGRLRWIVKDSGKGIATEDGAHLFEPFFCGRQAGRGLGLGLPRAARFAAQVGGLLSWRSKPGQGTSFAVEVPLESPPEP